MPASCSETIFTQCNFNFTDQRLASSSSNHCGMTRESEQDVTDDKGVSSQESGIVFNKEKQVKSNFPVDVLLSRLTHQITSMVKQQSIQNEVVNKKLGLILKQQSNIDCKLNLLATKVGVDLSDLNTA